MASKLAFSPKAVSLELLAELPDRSRAILIDRYGLSGSAQKRTLEAIGQEYSITRERVRQIENHALAAIRASESYRAHHQTTFQELKSAIDALGSVLSEASIVNALGGAEDGQHLVFLLTVGQPFQYAKETPEYVARWMTDAQLAEQVHAALAELAGIISRDDLIAEEEIMRRFEGALAKYGVKKADAAQLSYWLALSRMIAKNPLGEWGRADSPLTRVKSMRDFAYLTLKRHGSPMHFTEVAETIEKLFGRKAHPATCHNELINDQRFVLVGRGLYALAEWGYHPGVVRDVIREILAKEGPLSREEVIERVKRERYVKDATITVNLQDTMFVCTPDGKYAVAA
ncbi:MAG TPA: sigma factor-like helix-turn-helix DNA-binding protein [Candidatus Paceibacterota bacterium]|nr:sigma factor-like helix-turn-helix DNA-binding protein [Candidatus Paceibacterota bacterium]